MKLLLEKWRKYVNEDDKFSGNCGMFAIALGEEAAKRGKEVVMVVAHNAEDLIDLLRGEPDVYHIAVEIDPESSFTLSRALGIFLISLFRRSSEVIPISTH